MKICLLFLFLSISHVDLRRHSADIDSLDDLLLNNDYNRPKHRSNKQYIADSNEDDQYIPSYEHKKVHPSRKKVLDTNDYEDENENENDNLIPVDSSKSDDQTTTDRAIPTKTNQNDVSAPPSCINNYEIKSEQLVKVKELKNDAHMIRYVLIDKPISSDLDIKDICMKDCCAEKSCDLAMLSEQLTHEGYKCYLFACNGSCTLASHKDYSIMIPKKDAIYYTKSGPNTDEQLSSTLPNSSVLIKNSLFRETSVIILLVFGVAGTILLLGLIFCHCRNVRKRGRRHKNFTVDSDYLINGLYL